MGILRIFSILALLFSSHQSFSEPWLSSRFAQNCSGCHAPGRRNLAPKNRRCSLSCQGCHVNPNGGGLRSAYGKWNENNWLKTVNVRALLHDGPPAPIKNQPYFLPVKNYKSSIKKRLAKSSKLVESEGLPLKRLDPKSDVPDEALYDRYHDTYYDKLGSTNSPQEKLYVIPDQDPYREMLRGKVDAGSDVRFATLKRASGNSERRKTISFLMNADFGIRWRPVYKKYHFVYESRISGGPGIASFDRIMSKSETRSLYFMVDDLPYNIFAMTGYYRPLFGDYSPDHYALSQIMQGAILNNSSSNDLLYQALSIGTAPNVPYLNIHLIGKNKGSTSGEAGRNKGIAFNSGLRFVSFGGSLNYSFWSSQDDTDPAYAIKVVMHSIGIRGTLLRNKIIMGLEGQSFERDDLKNDFRKGGVINFDTKFRFFREMYATLDYAKANVTPLAKPGSASQSKIGIKNFLYPGFEWSTQYAIDDIKENGSPSSQQKSYLALLHLYY